MASAEVAAAAWDQLPPDILQRILMLSAMPCVRRVCKAARDAFDAVNETLHIVSASGCGCVPIARAAVLRVVQRTPNLTAITIPMSTSPLVTLTDLTNAAAWGLHAQGQLPVTAAQGTCTGQLQGKPPAQGQLVTRLRNITGLYLGGSSYNEQSALSVQLQVLQQCTGLVHLDLYCSMLNKWTMYPDQRGAVVLGAILTGMPNLTSLCLERCRLHREGAEAVAPALQTLTKLQRLNLSFNLLGPAGMRALGPPLSAMPGLQTLDLSYNDCKGGEGAEALCEVLRNTPSLTHLDMRSNVPWTEDASTLVSVLQRMAGLQHLTLSNSEHCELGDAGMVALAPTLAALPRLHTLDLQYNNLGEAAMVALQPVIAREGSPLRSLNVSINSLGVRGTQALAAALSSASQLQTLDVMFTSMGEEGAAALVPTIRSLSPTLHTLKLGSDWQALDPSDIALALQPLTGLTHLRVGSRADGVATFAPALMGMRRLQVLNLERNSMGLASATALAQALPAFAGSLKLLHLEHCRLGEQEAAVLAPALAQATGLEKLHLTDNELGAEGGDALVPAFKAMRSLRFVCLRQTRLSGQQHLCIARALQGKEKPVSLSIQQYGGPELSELRTMKDVDVLV